MLKVYLCNHFSSPSPSISCFRNELNLILTTHLPPDFTCSDTSLLQQVKSGLHQAYYYSAEIVTQVNFDKIIDRIYLLFTSTFFPRHLAPHCIDSRLLPMSRHKRKEGISLAPVLKDEEVGGPSCCIFSRKTKNYSSNLNISNGFYTKKQLWA